MYVRLFALLFAAQALSGHSAPSISPAAPLKVDGRRLVDANGREFILQGVRMSGLEAISPSDAQKRSVDAMTTQTFRVLRQRWNLNAVRLPVSPVVWRRDGEDYLARVNRIVMSANTEGLVVVLVATDEIGAPSTEVADFWGVWAAFFRSNGMVVFDLYARPSSKLIPNWNAWRNGGIATDGRSFLGMQQLADRIRGTGATQLIAAAAFDDQQDFQGFTAENQLNDAGVIYEVHPWFDHALTDQERDQHFGFLTERLPVYAGEWGTPFHEDTPACRSIPADLSKASDAISQLLVYMFFKPIHWTAADFEPGQLIADYESYAPTTLNRPWTCGQTAAEQPGIGAILLLYLTGDPFGFGSLAADQIASAAGGPAGPVAPGEIVVIYGQGIGPEIPLPGLMGETGKLLISIGGTEVRFDGIAAPLLAADYYQVKVQVPWEIAGRESVKVRASYRDIPSNEITVPVVEASPGIFTSANSLVEALAINQDGTLNALSRPAQSGSIVALYATGLGGVLPALETGKPASAPYRQALLPIALTVGGVEAEILFAGAAPGLVGVFQINARIPLALPQGSPSQPLVLTAGARRASTVVRLWIR